ncbi:MAG: DUF2269 domain-containing protein [Actinomycetota bacterium]
MAPTVRKLALSAHLAFSVGWIGGIVAYLVLGGAAILSDEAATVRAAWAAMEIVGWYAIVPLAGASLVTGIVMALGTKWGLFRHYWVVISFLITVVCVAVLVLHMPSVTSTAAAAAYARGAALDGLGGDLPHPAAGLVLLLVVLVLNVHKPRGLTRYGWRKQQTADAASREPA